MLWALVKKEWQALRRDWHGLLVLFVMPSAFILIMSLALRDTYQTQLPRQIVWHYIDADHSAESRQLLQSIAGIENAVGERDGEIAQQALRDGTIDLLLEIDHGFADSLQRGLQSPAKVVVYHRAGTPLPISAGFEAAVQRAFALLQAANLLTQLTPMATAVGASLPSAEQMAQTGLIRFRSAQAEQVPMTAVQQSVPAWLIFSMFFVVIPIANIVIAEQQFGTLKRLRSMRVPMAIFLLSKVLPFYLIGLLQTLCMLVVGRYIVPLFGGDALQFTAPLLPFLALISLTSLAAIAFALLIACIARSTEQATTFGGVANIVMAALGGVMVPKMVMPIEMQALSAWSPMSWPLEAFLQLFLQQASFAQLMPALIKLALFALISFMVAARLLQKRSL